LELVLKSRNSPQLRILRNVVKDLPPSVVFHLTGVKSNRDAVGASVTIETASRRQTQTIRAGSGFLSQHSKALLFGVGDDKGPLRAAIRWPSGLVQNLQGIPINHNVWVEEGKEPSRMEPFKRPSQQSASNLSGAAGGEFLPFDVATWLLLPVAAPDFSLSDVNGGIQTLSALRGKPVLLQFWTSKSQTCISDLRALAKGYSYWSSHGLQLLSVNVDEWTASPAQQPTESNQDLTTLVRRERLPFPVLRGSEDITAIYNLVYRQIFDRHRDLGVPTSFLIDEQGRIVKVYQGMLPPDQVDKDFRSIPNSAAERFARGLPFASGSTTAVGRNHLSWGALFYQRGYLDQAEASFQQALADDPSSAEALYGIGSVYLNQNKNAAAREIFERCVKQKADYPDTLPDAWNNLGVIATRESNVAEAIEDFKQALQINPNHLLSLNNLGNAFRLQKKWDEARDVLERALTIAPEDPEANYSLGMVYAQTDDPSKAYDHLQRALKAKPDYPEALNNLGVLYLVTQRPDQAIATFQQCIRVAPAFDQAYLNLARVYVLRGARDRARELLEAVLKQHPDQPQAKQMLQQLQQ
jgi:tetratricopeptide (TPR) repeat protein